MAVIRMTVYNNMLNEIKKYFRRNKIRKLVKNITEAIYTEEYRLESLINRFSDKNNLLSLLQCYIAIKVASELNEPISNEIINNATDEFLTASKNIANRKAFDELLKLHKDLAKICFLEKMIAILERQQIYDTDKYTYEGLIYTVERNQKGPTSSIEREKYKKLANEYKEAVRKYDEYLEEDDEASKKAFEEWFNKIKLEVEEDIKKNGQRGKEDLEKEREDLMRQLLETFKKKNE